MLYRNVYLQMSIHSFFGGGIIATLSLFTILLWGFIAEKEMVLVNTNAHCIPIDKSTGQAKIKFPNIPADNHWVFLATTKKECYPNMHPYIVHVEFQNSHEWITKNSTCSHLPSIALGFCFLLFRNYNTK